MRDCGKPLGSSLLTVDDQGCVTRDNGIAHRLACEQSAAALAAPAQPREGGEMKEQDTVKAILQFLAMHHIPAWRMNSGAFRGEYKGRARFHRFGAKGMADIIGLIPEDSDAKLGARRNQGRFLAIEVKSKGQAANEAQGAFLATVNTNGGLGFVAWSVDDVQKELNL